MGRKQSQVGLSEALINFTKTFSPEKPCESVHLEKTRQTFYECETDIWLVMITKNPLKEDGTPDPDELSDDVLLSVASLSYKMFRLFNGNMQDIMQTRSDQVLRDLLKDFYTFYLQRMIDLKFDLFSTLNGLHFLPVDKNVYLRIQSFINWTENTFPAIQYSCFLFRDHLVWSGLEQDDMATMYKFINHVILKKMTKSKTRAFHIINKPKEEEEEKQSTDNNNRFLSHPKIYLGGRGTIYDPFITARPVDEKDSNTKVLTPDLFVTKSAKAYHLVIFHLHDTMCMFLVEKPNPGHQLDHTFFRNLSTFITPQLGYLAPILAKHWNKKQGYAEEYRYIYFNHMNLALKSSIANKGVAISRETMRILNEMHSDFEHSPEKITELIVRTESDGWIAGRKSDQREFYVLFDQKNDTKFNLLAVTEEVKKLSSTYFNNIFFD